MYSLFLIIHSWLRWGALIAGLLAVFMLVTRQQPPGSSSPATSPSDRWGLLFLIAMDLQLVVGLLLYFVVSPNMAAIRANFAEAMTTRSTRFWAVEHVTIMLAGVLALHLGRALARKARTPDSRRRRLLIGMAIALIAIIGGTPWPGTVTGRPLLRISGQS
ncbi:MAG: hypothetical protein AB7N65_08090 [Vicinamibacterales bacterium]